MNSAIFEFMNAGKSRDVISEKLGMKLSLEFKRILNDAKFDKNALVDNLHHNQSKANYFTTKMNSKTEGLSMNETLSAERIPVDGEVPKPIESLQVEESIFSGAFFYVVVAFILIAVAAVVGYKMYVSPTKEHKTEVLKSEANEGMKNVETNGDQTLVEVQGNADGAPVAADTPGTSGTTATPATEPVTKIEENKSETQTNKPVAANSITVRDFGRTLTLARKQEDSHKVKKTKVAAIPHSSQKSTPPSDLVSKSKHLTSIKQKKQKSSVKKSYRIV